MVSASVGVLSLPMPSRPSPPLPQAPPLPPEVLLHLSPRTTNTSGAADESNGGSGSGTPLGASGGSYYVEEERDNLGDPFTDKRAHPSFYPDSSNHDIDHNYDYDFVPSDAHLLPPPQLAPRMGAAMGVAVGAWCGRRRRR